MSRVIVSFCAIALLLCVDRRQPDKAVVRSASGVRSPAYGVEAKGVPHLISIPDPLQIEVDLLRSEGISTVIYVDSDINAVGVVVSCAVRAAQLTEVQKKRLCAADLQRRYQTSARFTVVDTFVSPSLK